VLVAVRIGRERHDAEIAEACRQLGNGHDVERTLGQAGRAGSGIGVPWASGLHGILRGLTGIVTGRR